MLIIVLATFGNKFQLKLIQTRDIISVSSRISKRQEYQGFIRKRAGSSFGQ
jgi:hypothetical protein